MASAEQLPSGRWRGVYRDADGRKRHTKAPHHRLKRDATAAAQEAEVKARRQASRSDGTLSARTTWGDWWVLVNEHRDFTSDTADNERRVTEKHLMPQWGTEPLNGIKRRDVQAWVDSLSRQGYEPTYVRRIYAVLRMTILKAIEDEVLDTSPLAAIRLPKIAKKAKSYVSMDDLEALAPHMRRDYELASSFVLETGLRPGELAGLHESQIDYAGWLAVSAAYVSGQEKIRDRPKDGDCRFIPLSPKALDVVRERIGARETNRPCGVPHFQDRQCTSPLVFRTERGAVLDQQLFKLALRRASEKAGLPRKSPYGLRRGFATRLARAGVDIVEIAGLMGHADIRQTQDYIQQSPGARGRVLAALGSAQ